MISRKKTNSHTMIYRHINPKTEKEMENVKQKTEKHTENINATKDLPVN